MPSVFKDATGREWTVAISVATVSRVRSLAKVDIMDAIEGKLIPTLMGDVVLLCNVLYAVCKPQADAAGITDEQFGEALLGDALAAGEEALMEAIVDFSHPSKRTAVARAWDKAKAVRVKAGVMAAKRMEDPALDRKIDEIFARADDPSPPPMVGS